METINPLDSRYSKKVGVLRQYFSEQALVRQRLRVELSYVFWLWNILHPEAQIDCPQEQSLKGFYNIKAVKKIEEVTKHDGKISG